MKKKIVVLERRDLTLNLNSVLFCREAFLHIFKHQIMRPLFKAAEGQKGKSTKIHIRNKESCILPSVFCSLCHAYTFFSLTGEQGCQLVYLLKKKCYLGLKVQVHFSIYLYVHILPREKYCFIRLFLIFEIRNSS